MYTVLNVHDYQTYTLECTTQLGVMLTAHTFSTQLTQLYLYVFVILTQLHLYVFVILYTNNTYDNYLSHLYRGSFYLIIRKSGSSSVIL